MALWRAQGRALLDHHSLLRPESSTSGAVQARAPRDGRRFGDYQVTLSSITMVRVVDGDKVLDSMAPVTFDGVRFVVLAAIDVPSLQPLVLEGLATSGAIVSSSTFQLPTHPLGAPTRSTGGGNFRPTT